MEAPLYRGGLEDVARLYTLLRDERGLVVYGYRLDGGSIGFGVVRGASELPLRVEAEAGPGRYRLRSGVSFTTSHQSPKNYLHPPRQVVARVREDLSVEEPGAGEGGVALFAVKPCDLSAVKVLDELFRAGANPLYAARRGRVKFVVVEECLRPGATCFCSTTGSGPTAREGFDVAYAKLGGGTVLFKPGSPAGQGVLEEMGLEEAPESDVAEYRRLAEEASRRACLGVAVEEVQRALRRLMGDRGFWERVSERCLACSSCNMVCPTCFCTELVDEYDGRVNTRVAQWVGCLSYTYGMVAGGHFRRWLYTRYRHFVLHKFLFYPVQTGRLGCVGCGRCVTWCPAGVDLRETLLRAVGEGGG